LTATDDVEEYNKCRAAFEQRQARLDGHRPRRRRKKMLLPGEGRYFWKETNDKWMTWQACWDYLKS
jgi:hypothetical protein